MVVTTMVNWQSGLRSTFPVYEKIPDQKNLHQGETGSMNNSQTHFPGLFPRSYAQGTIHTLTLKNKLPLRYELD